MRRESARCPRPSCTAVVGRENDVPATEIRLQATPPGAPLMAGLSLPDPDDRHVLAAAIASGAQVVVTFNLRHFPAAALEPFGVEAMHPDELVCDAIDLDSADVLRIVHEQAAALQRPRMTPSELLERLERDGLARSVARLRGLID